MARQQGFGHLKVVCEHGKRGVYPLGFFHEQVRTTLELSGPNRDRFLWIRQMGYQKPAIEQIGRLYRERRLGNIVEVKGHILPITVLSQ